MQIGSCGGLKRLWSGRRGTAAVEFAIIGFWLIMVLGAIIEVGMFLLIQFELQNASERAARLIRTNNVSLATQVSEFKSTLCAKLTIKNCTTKIFVDVRNAPSFEDLEKIFPVAENEPPNVGPGISETFSLGAPGAAGSVVITDDWQMIFPFLRPFSNVPGSARRLYGVSIFKNET